MELRKEEETIQTTTNNQSDMTYQQNSVQLEENWIKQDEEPFVSTKTLMSKKEFYQHAVMKRIRSNINTASIILYICSVATFVLNVVLMNNIFGIIDVVLVLGLALGVHIAKSRVCAGVMTVYSLINMIGTVIATGRLTGYLPVIAAIYALVETCNFHKAWKEYSLTGKYPGL